MDGTGISYYLRGLVDLVVSPALHIFKCRYHILFDAPRQENTCLCRHQCLKLISNHNLHTPWREKSKRPSVGQKRLLFKLLRILAVVLVEVSADLCGESESGRHRQSDGGHFSEICTFSSEEILHVCPTVGLKTSTRLALQPKECQKSGHRNPETSNLVKNLRHVKTRSFEARSSTLTVSHLSSSSKNISPCHLRSRKPTLPWRTQKPRATF